MTRSSGAAGEGAQRFNTEEIIQRRLQTASHEIENFRQYDYILVNDRLEHSIDILKSIVEAERLNAACRTAQRSDEQVVPGGCRSAPCAPNMMQQVQDDPGNVRVCPVPQAVTE